MNLKFFPYLSLENPFFSRTSSQNFEEYTNTSISSASQNNVLMKALILEISAPSLTFTSLTIVPLCLLPLHCFVLLTSKNGALFSYKFRNLGSIYAKQFPCFIITSANIKSQFSQKRKLLNLFCRI